MGTLLGPALRMLVSLGVVLALMYLAARLLRRTHGGAPARTPRARAVRNRGALRSMVKPKMGARAGRRTPRRNRIEVLARQALGKTASVTVLRVAGRTLLVGVTDGSVQLLSEIDGAAFEEPDTAVVTYPVPPVADVVANLNGELVPASASAAPSAASMLALLRERTVRRA